MLNGMMQETKSSTTQRFAPFDDGRGLYPDRFTTMAPIGMRDSIRRAAQLLGQTPSAFVRAAVEARLQQVAPSTKEA